MCEVRAELYLMCPDARMKEEVDITLVNEDNVAKCLDVWKGSSAFHFDHAFQDMIKKGIKVTPCPASKYVPMNVDYKITLFFCNHRRSDDRSSGEGAKNCAQVV